MNENEVLIYQFSEKNNSWFDATKNVIWYKRDERAWYVKYNGNSTPYHVSFQKMRVFNRPEQVEFLEVYYKESPCYKVKKLIKFNNIAYKIFYENGYTQVASADQIRVVKDTLKTDQHAYGVMAYYRRVVQENVKSEEDKFLLNQFDDIDSVNSQSVLSLYLKGRLEKNYVSFKNPVLYPFGVNKSQASALKMVFENRISMIEGPPGTGKTQTILNIISNIVVNNKSVAVVSNNNAATENIYDKLDKYNCSFIAAPLGNAENVDKFFEDYVSSVPSIEKKDCKKSILKSTFNILPVFFEYENKIKMLEEELKLLRLEGRKFLSDNSDFDFDKVKINHIVSNPDMIMELIVEVKEKENFSFFDKIKFAIKYRTGFKIFNESHVDILTILQKSYYKSKIKELKKQISSLKKVLEEKSFKTMLDEYVGESKTYFLNELADRYKTNTRNNYNKETYKRDFEMFIKDYPVILSSTYALAKCSKKGFLFDYLIVDESSQVNMASAILSMRIARNIVIVGDIKQLPQIDDTDFKDRNNELLNEFQVSRPYSYYGNSIMSSFINLYGSELPKQMLKEHYRCNPDIIRFCNKEFYNDELIVYTENKNNDYSMKVIKTVEGNLARKNPDGSGYYNLREIDEIKKLMEQEQLEDVGIITPYRYQAELLQQALGKDVIASTIHRFQGRENKTIIVSTVVNDINDFIDNENLINVAVSRAVDKFILVTSDKIAKEKTGVIADLVNYISYHNDFGKTDEGNIKSIYDLLYKDYSAVLERFRKKHPSNDFDSELLTKVLIEKILNDKKYNSLEYHCHVSLRDFIRAEGLDLTKTEYTFYNNPNSHTDFLIYNKMNKKPVLAIEVDGVSYHEQQSIQVKRDEKKNSIFKKANVPLLRLKTNESNERERIENELDKLLKSNDLEICE